MKSAHFVSTDSSLTTFQSTTEPQQNPPLGQLWSSDPLLTRQPCLSLPAADLVPEDTPNATHGNCTLHPPMRLCSPSPAQGATEGAKEPAGPPPPAPPPAPLREGGDALAHRWGPLSHSRCTLTRCHGHASCGWDAPGHLAGASYALPAAPAASHLQ